MDNRFIIGDIKAEEIFDSRGNPTLSVKTKLEGGEAVFAVPSGASTGAHEAFELRDGDITRFAGLGVKNAVKNVNERISPKLAGMDARNQTEIDSIMLEMDGTPNKSNLGGNAMIGVSVSMTKAVAIANNQELFSRIGELLSTPENVVSQVNMKFPYFYMNLINGGKHAKTSLPFQEYHIVPMVNDPEEAFRIGREVFVALGKILKKEFGPMATGAGDEGGYAPDMKDVEKPFEFLQQAVTVAGFTDKVRFAIDAAASSFYDKASNTYDMGDKKISASELLQIYKNISSKYNLLSIEDPFDEEDFDSFKDLREAIGKEVCIIGDDLTVTNSARIKEASIRGSIGGVIIKPNQVGTLTEALTAIKTAHELGVNVVVSHRSGETNDSFIADLAYASSAFGIKAGAPQKGERIAKYNRFIEIKNSLRG